jgi:hypothetical protein
MVKWEYCEVWNHWGDVVVRFLVDKGNGWECSHLLDRDRHNMAVALAQLGLQGWEVVTIHSSLPDTYTVGGVHNQPVSLAFLKRRIEEPAASP